MAFDVIKQFALFQNNFYSRNRNFGHDKIAAVIINFLGNLYQF